MKETKPSAVSVSVLERKICSMFKNYANGSCPGYRHAVHTIKQIVPLWFDNKVLRKKQELLDFAKDLKNEKPGRDIKIGKIFSNYTKPSSATFDALLLVELRSIRPDWFKKMRISTKEAIQELKALALQGKNRPSCDSTRLGRILSAKTRKNSAQFDQEIYAFLKSARPDWFDTTEIETRRIQIIKDQSNKKKLFLLSIADEQKPKHGTSDATALTRYTNRSQNCYDPVFTEEIKRLAPRWFKDSK